MTYLIDDNHDVMKVFNKIVEKCGAEEILYYIVDWVSDEMFRVLVEDLAEEKDWADEESIRNL